MVPSRIGRKEIGRAPAPQTGLNRTLLISRALTSPLGILTVFPALVLLVGLFLTLVGQEALRGSSLAMGKRQLNRQAALVGSTLRVALEQADPMLDQLTTFVAARTSEQPVEPAAAVLRDLLRGRAGVAYVSISFTDGAFQGAYLDADGTVRFQESHIEAAQTRVRRFDYVGHAALVRIHEGPSVYDPRTRPFYQQAMAVGGRVWTKPYAFYENHLTGITRAAPVYVSVDGRQRLHAVLTIDFDVDELSRLLQVDQMQDMRALLYTSNGTILAYPEAARRITRLNLPLDRVLTYHDLQEPVLDAFFVAQRKTPRGEFIRFEAGGADYLAMGAAVTDDPSLDWSVAYLVPEKAFFASLHRYSTRSVMIAGVAVLLAFGISFAFARLVVKARRQVVEARAEAQRANNEAKELGSYRLIACLGKGGMGEVWRAEHRLLAREAAIKLIRLDSATNTLEAQERFRREARTLAALRSRNTIAIFDYGVAEDGTFFYVMELLDGVDLDGMVTKYGPQPPGRVVYLLLQACRSLAEAHDAGLVHRDVKPANLFTCRAADEVDVVKVLDFGLVQLAKVKREVALAPPPNEGVVGPTKTEPSPHLTQKGRVMGTPAFIAPEQVLGGEVDRRADLYALGAVGYWLLTGDVMFKKDTLMQTLLAQVTEEPIRPSLRCVSPVPIALEELILSCLAKSPADRPQTARDLELALTKIAGSLPSDQLWSEALAHTWWQQNRPSVHTVTSVSADPAA